MNENLDTNVGDGSCLPEQIHKDTITGLHPDDASVAEALHDKYGRLKSEVAPTGAHRAVIQRYNWIAAFIKEARGRSMPPPTASDKASRKTKRDQAIRFEDFTPAFEQAVLACVIAHPEKFDLTIAQSGCFNGPALHAIAWEVFKSLRENGQVPSWLALEQLLRDQTKKRDPERFDEYLAVLAEIREVNAAQELEFVVARFNSWAKHQLQKRAIDQLAQNLEGTAEERDEAWAALQDSWRYGETCRFEDGHELIQSGIEPPPEIIEGVLHQGHKLMLGGSSKSFKTFTLIDLAISVAAGRPWWGFSTSRNKVLYVNYEIDRAFFKRRLEAVEKAKAVELEHGWFTHAYLRGDMRTPEEVFASLKHEVRGRHYGLVVFDPIYKMLHGRDENAASQVASLLKLFSQFAEETGAAIVYGNHFSKGNQATRESIDRVSGSGVFARDPDAIVTLTKHVNEGTFVAEFTLRNSPPIEPFCVRWDHPLMALDTEADPSKLKKPGGRPSQYANNELLSLLSGGPLDFKEWRQRAEAEVGIGRTAFYDRVADFKKAEKVVCKNGKFSLSEREY